MVKSNLEKIKAILGYDLSDENKYLSALEDRNLVSTDDYDPASSTAQQNMQLAKADLLIVIATAPNISEGGYSISLSDKNMLIDLANGIYRKYGEVSTLPTPKATMKSPW